jgi:transposase
MERRGRYPTEVKERAVRLVFEQQTAHGSQWATISSIAGKTRWAARPRPFGSG